MPSPASLEEGVVVVAVVVVALVLATGAWWIREQRVWKRIHAEPGYHPVSATRLHQELIHAGVRARYHLSGRGATVSRPQGISNQTPVVLVHRDDLTRAEHIRATMQREGPMD